MIKTLAVGPVQYGISQVNTDASIRKQEMSNIQYIRPCSGGRISHILTNFIPDISALNSKHFTFQLLNNRPSSTGQTT